MTCKRLSLCITLACALVAHGRAVAFSVDELRTLIQKKQLTTVAQVIEHLPDEYKENFTLAYASQSLQDSSYENPRAILFGRTAQFVLSFNGDPTHQHYSTIEAMQFREQAESFELYSIEFSHGGAEFSKPNPQVCASCHGSPPHPLWSSYEYGDRENSHWPGFYGSTHDAPMLEPKEKAAFERFRERAASHPRYRHLKLGKPGAPWFPYGTGPTLHRLRPNNRLGNLLARWHARQIVGLINRSDFVERHPRLAEAWLLQCPGTDGESYRRKVRRLFDELYPRATHFHVHVLLDSLEGERRARFMMEKMLTESESFGWDMTTEAPKSSGRFYTGIVTIDRLVGARWLATLDNEHWLKAYFKPWKSRELYDTFAEGYYERNVAPGDVGLAYDEVSSFYDEAYGQLACPDLMRSVLRLPEG